MLKKTSVFLSKSLSGFVQFNAKNRAKARFLLLNLRMEPRLTENFAVIYRKIPQVRQALRGVIAIFCFTVLSCFTNGSGGAERNDFNAVLFDNAGQWVDLDFQRENLTRGYWDSLYLNGELINTDETYPEERMFILNDKAEFDTIFNEFPSGVNFEKEMILLYGITSIYIRPVMIEKIKLENEKLNITLKYVRLVPPGQPHPPDASVPQMRWFVVKTDKLDIDTVEFSWSN